ncbi:MAG: hypothetical protein HYV09_29745 [Deltaproteobacteria bacterium]|nr:hypothetical protein [Deltaproteobacteria bacterium]
MENQRRGAFRPTTRSMAAVQPSADTLRGALEHLVTEAVGDQVVAAAVVADSIAALGVDEVPDDPSLYELLVRAYVAPAMLKYAVGSAVQAFVDAALGRGGSVPAASTVRQRRRDW